MRWMRPCRREVVYCFSSQIGRGMRIASFVPIASMGLRCRMGAYSRSVVCRYAATFSDGAAKQEGANPVRSAVAAMFARNGLETPIWEQVELMPVP